MTSAREPESSWSEPHRQEPQDEELQHVILDALFALGKDETDFDWGERMPVYRLDDSTFLDRCHAFLKTKRKPRDVVGLRSEVVGHHAYCAFTRDELLEAVRGDDRLVIEEDEYGRQQVRVRRRRDGKAKPRSTWKKQREAEVSRRSRLMAARAAAQDMPTIPDPGEDDPELDRTRLYPLWAGGKLYGEPQSREEERRQELECLGAEHYRRHGDLAGEIAHYHDILSRRPNDLAVLYYLARTFLENSEPEKVIELIGQAHRRYPRLLDFQEVLLDALFALGQDENDFEWAGEIRIFRLDQSVVDLCYEYLKRKRRPRSGSELEELISREGCCLFTGKELVEALTKDDRFIVENGGVRLRRSRDGKPRRSREGRAARDGR